MITISVKFREEKNNANSDIKRLATSPRTLYVMSIVGLALFILVGCSSASPNDTTHVSHDISVQLSWTYGVQDALFYTAKETGRFEDANLDVTLLNGGFKNDKYVNAIDQVTAGSADFGIIDAYNLILARADGKPLVAVAAIYQRSPAALISLADKNISRPQDLIGKRVAVTTGTIAWTYNAMLTTQGITTDQIDIVPRSSFGIDPLLNDEADAMSGWIINEGIMVEEAGYEPNYIVMSDYGTDTYALVLFTTETMITEQPEVVQSFVKATLAGMQDVVNNPDQATEYILQYDNNLDIEEQGRRLQASLPFLNPDGSDLGEMQAWVWESTYQILRDQGIITEPLDIEAVYNMTFWKSHP